ncbi:cadherin domain-containing protein [Novipirellula caenicola]|uniref:Cadherin domain-containing protein n=1 Tax=Novipirellula caenicola TaxID=1536901 RepID=A0ABP9VM87_9BACT
MATGPSSLRQVTSPKRRRRPKSFRIAKSRQLLVECLESRHLLAGDVVFISSDTGGTIGGIDFSNEDILAYEQSSGKWSLYFDGSDVGLSNKNVDAFHVNQNDGTILLSVSIATTGIPGLGRVEDSDIIRFTPNQLGPGTSGTFDFFLDGSDVGLSPGSEDIDAISLDDSGNLIISTISNYIVPGSSGNLSGSNADLLLFSGNTGSDNNVGTWSTYFDGSDIGLTTSQEAIIGASVQVVGPTTLVHLTTKGAFDVPGLSGDFNDIIEVDVNTLGDNTTANSITLAVDVGSLGLSSTNLDGIQIGDFVGTETFQGLDFYFSSEGGGSLGGVSFSDDDILRFDSTTGSTSMFFDGSDVGVTMDIDGFVVESDTSILISLGSPQSLPGIGLVDGSDIVRFSGTLGEDTLGSFTMIFDGSDVGLDGYYENVDGMAIDPVSGNLVISTNGDFSVPGSSGTVTGNSRDLLVFSDIALGTNTVGTFSIFQNGASVGLNATSEDVTGIWIDPLGLGTFVNTNGSYSVPGLSGTGADIFSPAIPLLLFDSIKNDIGSLPIDGIHVAVQNSPPEIVSDGGGALASVNVDENQVFVTDVDSTDPDGDVEGAGLSYAITGGDDSALFIVATSTGELTFLAAPDFENPADSGADGTYEVEVTVTDSGGLSDSQLISITVVDVNDAPVITSDGGGATAAVNAAENQTAVTTVTASDEDLPAQTLTYSISGGADSGLFSISSGGVLTFNAAPDFENPTDTGGDNVYDVQVTVTDDGVPNLSDVQDIAVTVTDANDAPVITSDGGGATAAVNAAENQTAVTTVTASDEDLPAQTFTYSISGGADSGLFSISSGGVLTFNAAPDFENPTDTGGDNVYDVQVTVTDDGAPNLSDVQDIAVTVTDVNDAPVITSDGGGATAAVNAAENQTAVTTVTASDEDLPAQTFTYSISGGADSGLFSISSGGVLTFNAAPDFENPTDTGGDNVYDVQVTVTDDGVPNLSDIQDIAVTVTNVNDAPVITSDGGGATAAVNAAENQTAVTTVTANDEDLPAQAFTYSISGGADSGLFSISSGGVLTFNAAPDFENPTDTGGDNVYDVQVTVTDDGVPNLSDVQDIAVTVTDANDAPVITSDGGGATAAVNAAENQTAVTTVTASDEDLPAQTLTYSISGGADSGLFSISSGGVLTFNAAPDFENPTDTGGDNVYDVQVTVTDDGAPNLSDIQDIAVTVTDVDPESTAVDDAYSGIVGNVGLDVPVANGLLSNDLGGPAAVTAVNGGANVGIATATTHGTVTVQADGSFLYEPDAGNLLADSFTYELDTATTATVNLTFGTDLVWFIDVTPSGAGNEGTLSDPFTSIPDYHGVAAAGDKVFIAEGSYTGPLNLDNNTIVIGEGAVAGPVVFIVVGDPTADLLGVTVPTDSRVLPSVGGTAPVITSATNGINLAQGNTVRGVDIGNTNGTGISGTSVGTSTVSDVSITGTGAGVNITTGTLAMSFDEISSSNAAGISLSGVSGDFDVATGTINAGSSTAVNISGNPVDLDVTLTSVSSDGATNGIVLSNTTGSFTITGDGSNTQNASGGTIANSTSHGILLTNTQGISLTSMDLQSPGDSLAEHGLLATNIQGNNLFRAGRVTGIGHTSGDGISINNTNTNLSLFEINNSLFTGVPLGGNDGIIVQAHGNSTMRVDVLNNSTFDSLNGDGLQAISNDTSNLTVNLKNSEFNTDTGGIDGGASGGVSRVTFSSTGTSTLTTVVEDNVFDDTGTQTGALPVSTQVGVLDYVANDSSNLIARIRRNEIFGVDQEQGIRVVGDDNAASLDVIVDDNDINNIQDQDAIFFYIRDATQVANISITDNDIGTGPDGAVGGGDDLPIIGHGIQVRVQSRNTTNGGGTNPNTPIVTNLLISGNDIVNNDSNETIDLESEVDDPDGASAIPAATLNATVTGNNLVNLGSGDELEADSEDGVNAGNAHGTSLLCLNMSANTLNAGAGTIVVDEDGGSSLDAQLSIVQADQATLASVNGIPTANVTMVGSPSFGAAACPTPTHAGSPALMAASGQAAGVAASLTAADLTRVVNEAKSRFAAVGLSVSQMQLLGTVTFASADLDDARLGETFVSSIRIDADAAGYGWFVDTTPSDDDEFDIDEGGNQYQASRGEAAGRIDLLSVVMHELGHALGLQHTDEGLMSDSLDVGIRRLPTAHDEVFANQAW